MSLTTPPKNFRHDLNFSQFIKNEDEIIILTMGGIEKTNGLKLLKIINYNELGFADVADQGDTLEHSATFSTRQSIHICYLGYLGHHHKHLFLPFFGG